eukprot:5485255-Prymnesium_polylepis.1
MFIVATLASLDLDAVSAIWLPTRRRRRALGRERECSQQRAQFITPGLGIAILVQTASSAR